MDGYEQDEHFREILDGEPTLEIQMSQADAEILVTGGWVSQRPERDWDDRGQMLAETPWKAFMRADAVAAVHAVIEDEGKTPLRLPASVARRWLSLLSASSELSDALPASVAKRWLSLLSASGELSDPLPANASQSLNNREAAYSRAHDAVFAACKEHVDAGGVFTKDAPTPPQVACY